MVALPDDTIDDELYRLTISLNVLNHLGINLYSNVPAVLAEVVANSWDADARTVEVSVDAQAGRITVRDDGDGMSRSDVNERFLNVGYRRREHQGGGVTGTGRYVMGRKGIGKLSLFSIARTIEVHTVKDSVRSAFRMKSDAIRELIERQEKGAVGVDGATGSAEHTYHPEALDPSVVDFDEGTRIVLTDLKKNLTQAELALTRRLARRFSVIGEAFHFEVTVNGHRITVEDRDYFHKVEYMWWYESPDKHPDDAPSGGAVADYPSLATKKLGAFKRESDFGAGYSVRGWVGTVEKPAQLKDGSDNLNKIVVVVRGKVAQEDLLEGFNEGGIYTKYLIGEIHADFLDRDDLDDIATSSRQRIIEDDERYQALRSFVQGELRHIETTWSDLRNTRGKDKALEIPAIKNWYEDLGPDLKKRAESLFGKINRLSFDDESDRRRLFKYCVLAFESLRYKENLDALDIVAEDNLEALIGIFAAFDDIEATLYHQIVAERIKVIDVLRDKVEGAALENAVRDHLYEHLWLLDPAWERATDGAYVEQSVAKAFAAIEAGLDPDEKGGRLDIRYKKASGEHVIVELKRSDRVVSTIELLDQIDKYQRALRKCLDATDQGEAPINTVCVVGKDLKDWDNAAGRMRSAKLLEAAGVRLVMYQSLLDGAYKAYSAYIEQREVAGRVQGLIESLEREDLYDTDESTEGT